MRKVIRLNRRERLYRLAVKAGVPVTTVPGLVSYLVDRITPGYFLASVLQNDLASAVVYADVLNSQALPSIVRFLRSEAPSDSFGSPESYLNWLQYS